MAVIRTQAPTRIDLAGGTLDLWPIYLMVPGAQTLNLAIDLWATTTLKTPAKGPDLILQSRDLNQRAEVSWSDLESVDPPSGLQLHFRMLRHFSKRVPSKRRGRLELVTEAQSPAGAGLGGSSALAVSLAQALARWPRARLNAFELVETCRDVESGLLWGPAGLQDYCAAAWGGLQGLTWGVRRWTRNPYPRGLRSQLASRLLLFYSGQSRNSGINNWKLFKSFLDRDAAVIRQFGQIAAATSELARALDLADWQAVGRAIQMEWAVRRELAPGITTPAIEQALERAMGAGATAGKVCGAGGGGCFFVYVPTGNLDPVRNALEPLGVKPLPFRAV